MAVEDAPFRVIADHARAATMLIADGVCRPTRDAATSCAGSFGGRSLRPPPRHRGARSSPSLVEPVFAVFEGIYLRDPSGSLKNDGREHDPRRGGTASPGRCPPGPTGSARRSPRRGGEGETILSGAAVFRFYDTHGIPLELIEELAPDEGVSVDRRVRKRARGRARALQGASKFEQRAPSRPKSWSTRLGDRLPRVPRRRFRQPRRRAGARRCLLATAGEAVDALGTGEKDSSSPTAPSSTPKAAARWPTRASPGRAAGPRRVTSSTRGRAERAGHSAPRECQAVRSRRADA